MNNPRVSIVVGYRNRDLARISFALESVAKQSFQNFELIFVDYGSEPELAYNVRETVEAFPFATYLYADTRGWFWNRAHALNIGVRHSRGELVVFSDIDLILPSDFLEKLNKLSYDNCFYTFMCYYLPKPAKVQVPSDKDLESSSINYVGLCAASRGHLLKINGFDEYYMNWGGEDDDLYARLIAAGLNWEKPSIEEFPVLHQWHPTHTPRYPTPWYLEMVNRLYSGVIKCPTFANDFGYLVKTTERPLLSKLDNFSSFKKLELFPNPTFQYNIFLDSFFKMRPGEYGYFELPLPPVPPKGRKQKVVDYANKVLIKYRVPFKIVKRELNLPIHDKQLWEDFIMYFVGKHRSLIFDYYILKSNEALSFIFKRKC